MNPALIGAGVGAAASFLGGSKQAGTTTTTQGLPRWLKRYTIDNLDMAGEYRDDLAGAGRPLLDASQEEMMKILSGAYLTPESNPHLKQYGDAIADRVGASVDSRFNLSGRTGSFAHADALSKSIGEAILPLYSTAYEAERGRQYGSAVAAPGVVGGGVQAEMQPFISYASLFPNLRTQEQPYFTNRTGEALSGALAGAGIGRMYGADQEMDWTGFPW